jgi:hypothetical protein
MSLASHSGELNYVLQEIPANLLDIDPGVQRDLNPNRVKKIADNFNEHSLGVLVVSRRSTGQVGKYRYVVLDGQTRLEAIRKVTGQDDTTMGVMCQIYTNLSRREEAEIFLTHNDRSAVRKIDRFRIALVAQEQWAEELNAVVIKHGFEISPNVSTARRVTAIGTLERLYRMDGGLDSIDRAFDTLTTAWGHQVNAASDASLAGLGLLYQRHPGQVDFRGLANRLASAGSSAAFRGEVSQRRQALELTLSEAAYRYVIQLHDKGRKSRRIGS